MGILPAYKIQKLFEMGIGEGVVSVFNAIFNNISVISWHSVLLVVETGVPEENH